MTTSKKSNVVIDETASKIVDVVGEIYGALCKLQQIYIEKEKPDNIDVLLSWEELGENGQLAFAVMLNQEGVQHDLIQIAHAMSEAVIETGDVVADDTDDGAGN